MAKKKSVTEKASQPKRFSDVIRGLSQSVQKIARQLRDLVYEELPYAEERFYGAARPMAMHRTTADVCYIQPQAKRCNIYFCAAPSYRTPDHVLEGTSERFKHAKFVR